MDNDTICLLKECDSGSKMAVSAIDEVLEKIKDGNLKELLTESKGHHEELREDIQNLLRENHAEEKEPNPMAKGMAWAKTNMMMGIDESDATAAEIITDGCNMGVKTLCRYENQYKAADKKARDLCHRLISIEETLAKDIRGYL